MLHSVDVVGAHGVVSRDELLAAGLSRDAIKHRLKRGELIAIHRGVYAIGRNEIPALGRVRAALLATGARAAASHSTAAYLDHLTPTLPAVVHVTVTGGAQRSRPGVVVHRTTRGFAERRVAGLRVTPTLRTLEDLRWDDALVREALARGRIRPEQLPERVDSMPTQSELERRMRRLSRDAGLPQPVAQWKRGRYRIDFAWPEHRVLLETDGWGTHGRRQAFEDDRDRDAELAALGFVVIRVTWRQIERTPTRVAARLAAVLALAAGAR